MSFLDVMKVGLGEISMPRGRKKVEKTEEEKLEERVKQKEKEFIEGKKEVATQEEGIEEVIEEQPKEVSLEEVIYGLSGQAAILDNLNRFELTPAERNALSTGVEFITSTISGYIEELKGTERKNPYIKGITPAGLTPAEH